MPRYSVEINCCEVAEEWKKGDEILVVNSEWWAGTFEVETDDPSIFDNDEFTFSDEWEFVELSDFHDMDMDVDEYEKVMDASNGWEYQDTTYKVTGGVTATRISEEVSDFIKEGIALKEGTT